jgi:NADPH-dependent 2,4-dienoyl-CoA reductase/sulfur reductase-like enzyme
VESPNGLPRKRRKGEAEDYDMAPSAVEITVPMQGVMASRDVSDPDVSSVLVVGAGPAGLMLA